jgi:hypothetical protein
MKDARTHASEFPILSPDVFSVDLLVGFLTKQLQQVPHSIFPMHRLTIAVSRFTQLQEAGSKKWSTLDQFYTGAKRAPDFENIRVEQDVSMPVPKKTEPVSSAKKGPLLEFLKPKKQSKEYPEKNLRDRAGDEWSCEECPETISMWNIDAIQEHQDFHLACRLSAQ